MRFCVLCVVLALAVLPRAALAATPDVWLLEETGADGNKAWCAFHGRDGFLAESRKVGSGIFGGLLYTKGALSEIDELAEMSAGYVLYQSYFLSPDGSLAKFERRSEMAKFHVIVVEDYEMRQGAWVVVETKFLDQVSGKPLDKPRDVRWPFGPVIHTVLRKFPFYPLIANPAIRIVDKVCAGVTEPGSQ